MATTKKSLPKKTKIIKLKNPGGRPTRYTEKLADLICYRVATNAMGIKRLYKKYKDFPADSTIHEWRWKYPKFSSQYAHAKALQMDILIDENIDIAYEATPQDVQVAKLRIDTNFRTAALLAPKKYGDKPDELAQKERDALVLAELTRIRNELDKKNEKDY